jgi:hypothetical protein
VNAFNQQNNSNSEDKRKETPKRQYKTPLDMHKAYGNVFSIIQET